MQRNIHDDFNENSVQIMPAACATRELIEINCKGRSEFTETMLLYLVNKAVQSSMDTSVQKQIFKGL